MSLMLTKQLEGGDFVELLSELTWLGNQYVGTQRAVARITGLAKTTIARGLALDPSRTPDEPKLLKWLAAQGVKVAAIQREWQEGKVKDAHIALLIRYAATESQSRPEEAQRWQKLIEAVGFRQVIHQLNGREDLVVRRNARGEGLKPQRAYVDTLAQSGKNIGQYRADLVKFLTGGFQPKRLQKMLRTAFPAVPESHNWRSHADAETLLLTAAAENIAAVTGSAEAGRDVRTIAIRGGWSGNVEWHEEAISPDQCDSRHRRLKASDTGS